MLYDTPVIRESATPRQAADIPAAPRVLGGLLLDTLEALGAAPLDDGAAAVLSRLWERAHGAGEKLRAERVDDGPTQDTARMQLGPALDVVSASRGSPYPLMLVGPHWRLQVNPWRGTARLALNALYLATVEHADVAAECERIACWLWRGRAEWRVSRLDVAADVVGLDVARFARLDECVTRAAGARVHVDGEEHTERSAKLASRHGHVETVTLGSAGSSVQVCIYDKAREMKASGKTWQAEHAKARGWDGVEPLTRIEARFRRAAFDELDGARLRDVRAALAWSSVAPRLWAYATTKAVRYCTPTSDTNRARWPIRDDWRVISECGTVAPIRCRRASAEAREERKRRASRAVLSGLVTLAAENAIAARMACESMTARAAEGIAPEIALAAVVFHAHGELVGVRALGVRDALERAHRMRERIHERLRWHEWQDDPARAFALAAA